MQAAAVPRIYLDPEIPPVQGHHIGELGSLRAHPSPSPATPAPPLASSLSALEEQRDILVALQRRLRIRKQSIAFCAQSHRKRRRLQDYDATISTYSVVNEAWREIGEFIRDIDDQVHAISGGAIVALPSASFLHRLHLSQRIAQFLLEAGWSGGSFEVGGVR